MCTKCITIDFLDEFSRFSTIFNVFLPSIKCSEQLRSAAAGTYVDQWAPYTGNFTCLVGRNDDVYRHCQDDDD